MSAEDCTIPLTRGVSAIVDAADYEWLSQWKWHANIGRNGLIYAVRRDFKRGSQIKQAIMHREIMGLRYKERRFVDHINGNTLDNRRSNLRIATASQNQYNSKPSSVNKSGKRGVNMNSSGSWEANIKVNGKGIYLGQSKDFDEACRMRDEAETKYHGEFKWEPTQQQPSRPADNGKIRYRMVSAFGETKHMSMWAEDPRCIPTYKALQYRLMAGMAPELAITTPPMSHVEAGKRRAEMRKQRADLAATGPKEWTPACTIKPTRFERQSGP